MMYKNESGENTCMCLYLEKRANIPVCDSENKRTWLVGATRIDGLQLGVDLRLYKRLEATENSNGYPILKKWFEGMTMLLKKGDYVTLLKWGCYKSSGGVGYIQLRKNME